MLNSDNTSKWDWEGYVTYWQDRVKQANDGDKIQDKIPGDEMVEIYLNLMNIKSEEKVLDYGCGTCRVYPIYKSICPEGKNYFGVDIAQAPLDIAMKSFTELEEKLKKCDGITLPFDNSIFDKIVCYGVLDVCEQEVVLQELLRVLAVGGKLLISGKNTCYHVDDELALVAEVNARKKGCPNHFTNVQFMKQQLIKRGIEVEKEFYFGYRADFADNNYTTQMPKEFYQWIYILKKNENSQVNRFDKFCDGYSETFKRLKENE